LTGSLADIAQRHHRISSKSGHNNVPASVSTTFRTPPITRRL
jgi:hypothetical protein